MNTEEMQKIFKWIKIVLVILALFLATEALEALKNLKNIDPASNSISVNGEGEVVSKPDVATFSFSVSADSKTASVAQEEVTKKMNSIIAGLKELDIEERDIKTLDYSIWPKYRYEPIICSPTLCPPSRQIEDGYTVAHSLSIKVRKIEKAGVALALVGERGATNLSGISFTVDDPEKIIDEARALAIRDAKEKAKTLAENLGVRLVRVVSFSDSTGGGTPFYAEGIGRDLIQTSKAPAPTLPVGENKTVVNVTVVYEIR